MILKLITNNNNVQEINIKEIIEIDGKPFSGVKEIDVSNLEDRIQILERLTKNLCDFMDQFVVPETVEVSNLKE